MYASSYAMQAESKYRTQRIIRDHQHGLAEERLLNLLATSVSSRIRSWLTVPDKRESKLTNHLATGAMG